ncbi:MAG: malto-oligosyltrehalose synthase [Arcanobacterium sp.]
MGTQRYHSHIPHADRRQPVSTYRIQLSESFTFADARGIIDYLTALGVTDVFLSPILQAAPGSQHGYDVVDHAQISRELGGIAEFRKLSRAIHDAGMYVVVDIVPNHMAVPTPLYHNRALWSVLREGEDSAYASWFDIDFSKDSDGLLLPVLGSRIGKVLTSGEITVDKIIVPGHEDEGPTPVLRYYDHVFPIREGTEALPLNDLLERQFYRLAYWRVANEELNYRRFFDVDTLAAIKVEDPEVFDRSHQLLLDLFHEGLIDSFRIDHPDGLADPRGYFRRLHEATGGAWLVAEKILEGEEALPDDWPCAGTTGYDGLRRIQGLFTDPAGMGDMLQIYGELSGSVDSIRAVEMAAKRQIVATSLFAEMDRLANLITQVCYSDVRLRDHTYHSVLDVLTELVVQMPRYRAYVVPGERPSSEDESILRDAAVRAERHLDNNRKETLAIVVDLLLGNEIGSAGRTHEQRRHEAIIRFQQVCGAVMAKGVEDTTFYRYTMLLSANEVGGGPSHPTTTPDEFYAWQTLMHQAWPVSGVVTSTHDAKRSENVRAVIAALSEHSKAWTELLGELRPLTADSRGKHLDGQIENLVWQTVIGTWTDRGPIEVERLEDYLLKAAREQKSWTTWTEQNTAAEQDLLNFARSLIADPHIVSVMEAFYQKIAPTARAIILGTRTLHTTMVGVPDLYQGEEITQNSLVDPDNRRPVDFDALAEQLADLDDNGLPSQPTIDEEKLWVTSRAMRLRRANPELASAAAGYAPLPVSTAHALAFARVVDEQPLIISIVTRQAAVLKKSGGFGEHTVVLPEGNWRDIYTGNEFTGGSELLADILDTLPCAVLERA